MINIILVFMAGMLCGGICVYSRYNKLRKWTLNTLRDIDAKSMDLRAQIETLRLFYGVRESDDA